MRKFTFTAGKLSGGILKMYHFDSACTMPRTSQLLELVFSVHFIFNGLGISSYQTKSNFAMQIETAFSLVLASECPNNWEKCSKLWFQENTGPDAWWSCKS